MRSTNPGTHLSASTASHSAGHSRYQALITHSMWTALALHTVFAVFFAVIGLMGLAAFNVGSVLLYAVLIVQLRHGRFTLSVLLTTAEVLAHAWLALSALGLESGFQYYFFVLVPAAFFHPNWRLPVKVGYLLSVFAAYVVIDTWHASTGSVVGVAPQILLAARIFNLFATFAFVAYVTGFYTAVARRAEDELEHLATVDPLTGLYNRRHMLRMVELERARLARSGKPAAIVIADIDDFKRINDRLGHACGDLALRHVAECLREVRRGHDHVARWGGEEFLLLLSETDLEGGRVLAEKLRARVADGRFTWQGQPLPLALTAAVAELGRTDDFEAALARVDAAMLEGKREGKNRVVTVLGSTPSNSKITADPTD